MEIELGARFKPSGAAEFSVWAPKAHAVELKITHPRETSLPMSPMGKGRFHLLHPPLEAEHIDYYYRLDGNKELPDPRSRCQPFGVHGPSRLTSCSSFNWSDGDWRNIALKEYIIYELHVGTFTPEGTFSAIIPKLQHLKELGITAIEIMPIAQFPGERNWGYDGVFPFAPAVCYGGEEGLKLLVDECHRYGLAVILDVVYNHLGPEGNYFGDFGYYFTERYHTPWGDAINYDSAHSDEVRAFVIDNALYWLLEYHIDALRLDAIDAICDQSPKHLLEELHSSVDKTFKNQHRNAYLIAESDLNDTRILNPPSQGGYGIEAQWNDDFHHALYSLLYKTSWGYFRDFGALSQLAKAYYNGFVYDGIWSQYRQKSFGSSSDEIEGWRLVVCIENHDQIGNASLGKRFASLVDNKAFRLASLLLFTAPNLPLMFMGQEWGSATPFCYFTDFEDEELGEKVKEGFWRDCENKGHSGPFHHPQSFEQFQQCKLTWEELDKTSHNDTLQYYRQLIAMRKRHPSLNNCRKDLLHAECNEEKGVLSIHRNDPSGEKAIILANFTNREEEFLLPESGEYWQMLVSSNQAHSVELPGQSARSKAKRVVIPALTAELYISAKIPTTALQHNEASNWFLEKRAAPAQSPGSGD